MADAAISPARNLTGAVRLPGDKSISHRYGMLCALAEGRSHLENFAPGGDCESTLQCMRALGANIARNGSTIDIDGVGMTGLRPPAGPLDAGNSGSTLRMLSGILAAQPFATTIDGDASLRRRPMRRIIEPLSQMGAQISGADGKPPLNIEPVADGLHGIDYMLPVASAQVKTSLLFAGLFAHGTTAVTEPQPTRDHSEIALLRLGVPLRRLRRRLEIDGPVQRLAPAEKYEIPGDPSSAAFFLCAAAMFPEADLLVDGVSLNPTRSALLDVLRRMGAGLEVVSLEDRGGEIVGSLHLDGARHGLRGTRIEGAEAVALIDEVPVLAVLATAAEGGIEFADVGELRVKESDRISSIATNLRAMGARCEETPTGLVVPGPQKLRGARVESFHDHRIAMAFGVAALRAEGHSLIAGSDCVAISYPDFFATLERLAER